MLYKPERVFDFGLDIGAVSSKFFVADHMRPWFQPVAPRAQNPTPAVIFILITIQGIGIKRQAVLTATQKFQIDLRQKIGVKQGSVKGTVGVIDLEPTT